MAPMDVQVSFRGKPQRAEGVYSEMRVAQLKEKLEGLTTVPVAQQKLILKGKVLQSDDVTLEEAGIVSKTVGAEGNGRFTQAARLMLVGSIRSEVQVVHDLKEDMTVRNYLRGKAVPKGYKKVALNFPSAPPAHWRYRFQRIETLPGLPQEDKARELLESLADDPGVRAVLEKHRWTVGALCELHPEGKVDVSKKRVLGLNYNHGDKILLRLRTDNLKGFRKMLSIRKVLFHELAHNTFSGHGDNFYRLMRQIENEAAELDWRQQSGRTLVGGEPGTPAVQMGNELGYILVKEAFEGGSGRLGGDSKALMDMFSAQQLAGQAAILRLTPEEQEVEDCCGHTKGNEGTVSDADAGRETIALPTEMGGSELTNAAMMPHRVREEEEKGELDESEADGTAFEHLAQRSGFVPKTPGLPPTVLARDAAADRTSHSSSDVGNTEENQHIGVAGLPIAVNRGGEGVGVDGGYGTKRAREGLGTMQEGMAVETIDGDVNSVTSSSLRPQHRDRGREERVAIKATGSSFASSGISTAMNVAEDDPQMLSPTATSPLDDLVVMGFARDVAVEALIACEGSISDAIDQLLTSGESDAVVVGRSGPGDKALGSTGGGGDGEGSRLSRDVRVQEAAERIAGYDDRSRALKCLQVLEVMLRNIMEHPAEEKFRRVRRSNGMFKASVSSVPGAVELLLAAGFEVRGTDLLELGRHDTGLIWLTRSTVEGWRECLAAGVYAKSITL